MDFLGSRSKWTLTDSRSTDDDQRNEQDARSRIDAIEEAKKKLTRTVRGTRLALRRHDVEEGSAKVPVNRKNRGGLTDRSSLPSLLPQSASVSVVCPIADRLSDRSDIRNSVHPTTVTVRYLFHQRESSAIRETG